MSKLNEANEKVRRAGEHLQRAAAAYREAVKERDELERQSLLSSLDLDESKQSEKPDETKKSSEPKGLFDPSNEPPFDEDGWASFLEEMRIENRGKSTIAKMKYIAKLRREHPEYSHADCRRAIINKFGKCASAALTLRAYRAAGGVVTKGGRPKKLVELKK